MLPSLANDTNAVNCYHYCVRFKISSFNVLVNGQYNPSNYDGLQIKLVTHCSAIMAIAIIPMWHEAAGHHI